MNYNQFNNNWPDFSKLFESTERIRKIVQPMVDAVQDLIKPIRVILEQDYSWLVDAAKNYSWVKEYYEAIEKLGEAQFVCWDYLDDDFVDTINAAENINKALRQHILQDKLEKVNETIKKTCAKPKMNKYRRLYDQSVEAFLVGSNELAVTGFTSVFDGLLADISKNPTHKLSPRIGIIKEKLENSKALGHDEIAIVTLGITIKATLDSFSAPKPFSEPEPRELNRHWIAHGRSHKKRTKLDCVKMINLIYGLLLITELDSTGPIESE